jgi:hypothetical protein
MDGWDEVVGEIIHTVAVPMAQSIADACNIEARELADPPPGKDHYMVSVQGEGALRMRDYHATVITATAVAMRQNAKHNLLVRNLHRAAR